MSSSIDLDSLMVEVSPDDPVGEDLEYDADFTSVFREARGRDEQSMGDASIAADPANWKLVSDQTQKLFHRSKDLRLAVLLLRAQINIHGLSGLHLGLQVIVRLLNQYWSSLHPQLDPEDDNDPTLRINTVLALCDRDYFLNALSEIPLVSVKGIGAFSLKDIQLAKSDSDDQDVANISLITAAFLEADIEQLQKASSCITLASESVLQIDKIFIEHLGTSQSPDFQPLVDAIERCRRGLIEFTDQREDLASTQPSDVVEGTEDTSVAAQPPPVTAIAGEIRSREDAAKMMDKISEFYQKNEPSSPVPIFMQRAKRISMLSFMEIVADLAPDGLAQIQHFGGETKE